LFQQPIILMADAEPKAKAPQRAVTPQQGKQSTGTVTASSDTEETKKNPEKTEASVEVEVDQNKVKNIEIVEDSNISDVELNEGVEGADQEEGDGDDLTESHIEEGEYVEDDDNGEADIDDSGEECVDTDEESSHLIDATLDMDHDSEYELDGTKRRTSTRTPSSRMGSRISSSSPSSQGSLRSSSRTRNSERLRERNSAEKDSSRVTVKTEPSGRIRERDRPSLEKEVGRSTVKVETPDSAGIRTRLKSGSIQMNGTTTISAAKERAELEAALQTIARSKPELTAFIDARLISRIKPPFFNSIIKLCYLFMWCCF